MTAINSASRVLVVDDDADNCYNIQDILSDLGYQTDIAHDGPQALQLIQQRSYDIALIDYKMPGMDGIALHRELKRLRPEVVTIMVTGYASEEAIKQAIEAGTWRVLTKPVDFVFLLTLIDQALAEPLVLVVDDDSDFCETIWQLLRERGYRVAIAYGERLAISKVREAEFRAALVDLMLGDGDGRRVLAAVRAAHPQAGTILITGHRSDFDQLISQLPRDGIDAVCFKPLDFDELLSTLRELSA